MLEDLSQAATAVASAAGPAVVRIRDGRRGACGIVVAEGRLLTNAHNIHRDRIDVRFADDRVAEAVVKGIDEDGDIAVLEVDAAGLTGLPFADAPAALGQPVFAVATAGHGPRISFGLVSAVGVSFRGPRGRRISGSIEHTAAMAPGSSGSALVDASGRLLGVNTNRLGNGFYQALPADEALRGRIESLAAGTAPVRPRLGIAIAPAWVARRMRAAVGLRPRDGLLVREVEADSAAERAGIATGDLLVAVDGRALRDADDLMDALDAAGGRVRLDVLRGEEERSLEVDLVEG